MRLLVLVALATVTAATGLFRPGEEYVYHYKGHVLSGVPKASKQFAGILIDTIVTFQFQQDYKVVMKLDKIKLFKINNVLSTPPEEPLNENEITLLTGEQATVLIENLIKPIKFRYVDGEVQELEKEASDKYWSINIKKGILSLFQVTLKDKSPSGEYSGYDLNVPRTKYPYPRGGPTPFWRSNRNSVYTVMETDVTGTCETKYSLITDKSTVSSSTSEMFVTAVRDFNTCQTEPFYIQGIFQGVYKHPEEENLLQPMVETTYTITGDRSHFLIKEAKLRGKYSFLPHGLEGGSMSTIILQTLKLKTTQPINRPRTLTNPLIEKHGLLMVIPKASQVPEKKTYDETPVRSGPSGWNNRRPTYQSRDYWIEEEEEITPEHINSIIPVIDEKLNKLVECVYSPTETKCSETLYQITRILRELPKPVLKTIYMKHVLPTTTGEMEYRKSEVLLDVLPTMMSVSSSKVLLELIKEKRISELRASLMINAMSLVAKPTPSVINTMLELFKELPKHHNPKIGPKVLLRNSLLLGVGTMTHRMINVMRSHGKPVPEVVSYIETVSGELKRMLTETTSIPEKLLVLHSIGNMGASQTIQTLKTIVEDVSQPLSTRLHAIYALRRPAKQFRKQVMPILLSIFMDIKEHRNIREAALIVIMKSKPGLTTLQMIGHRLRHEPSHQLRTLVYSSLVNLATHTSHEPEHKELKQNAKLVLRTIPPVFIGPYDTFAMKLSKFSEEYDKGLSLEFLKVKSMSSGLPFVLYAQLQGTAYGSHKSIVEAGILGSSVEKVLRKIVGPHSMLSEFMKGKVTLEDFIRPFVNFDWTNVEYKIKELLSKTVTDMTSEEKPTAYWFLYVLESKIQHIFLTTENTDEIIEKITTILPEIVMKLTRGLKVDIIKSIAVVSTLTIASPIGIPLTVNSSLTGVGKVDGFVKIHNLPTVSELFRRTTPFTVPKIGLDVDLKPTFDVVHYLSVGVNMRWLTSGVYLEALIESTLPTKFNVHFKGPEHEITIKKFIPKHTFVPLHAKVTPKTFITYVPTTVTRLPYTFETKEILNSKIVKVTPFEHKYKCSISGLEVETKGTFSVCGPQWCPSIPLFGKQSITIKATPLTSVDFVQLKVKSLKSNVEWEGVPLETPTEELYGFETEDDSVTELYPEGTNPRHFNYRNTPGMMVTSGEFDPITPDPILGTQPIKRQLLVTLGPNTNVSPKIKGLFTWLMSRRYWKHQTNVQVVRMSHEETPTWKVKVNTVVDPLPLTTLIPTIPTYMYLTETPGEFLARTHITWMYGGLTNELTMKLIPGSPIDFSRELKEHKIITAFSLPEARLQKFKVTLETEVAHMSRPVLKIVNLLHDTVQYYLYDYITTSVPAITNTNKFLVAVELLPIWEQMNIIVKTPVQNSYIANVPLYLNPLFPTNNRISLHDLPNWIWYRNMTFGHQETPEFNPYTPYTPYTPYSEYTPEEYTEDDTPYPYDPIPYKPSPIVGGECIYDDLEKVLTSFDGVTRPITSLMRYQRIGCKITIAKVCQNERLFNVVGYTTPRGGHDLAKLDVTTLTHEIELILRGDRVVVRVNGEEKPLHTSQPLIISEEYSETSPKVLKLEKFTNGVLELKLYELGVKVLINPEQLKIKIKLAPWSTLQGELCGICGNYNLDQSDDFTTDESLNVPNRPSYFETNVMPSETCDLNSIYPTEHESCKTENILTFNRYENDLPMTCRSENKVTQCAPGCRPVKTESIKTCFTCTTEKMSRPPRTYYTPRWEDDTGVECSDFYQRIEVPTICVPVY